MVAVLRRATKAVTGLFDRSFDPAAARRLPVIDAAGESNVRGLYLVGEIAGTPLIKLGLNRGRAVVDHIARHDLKKDEAAPTSEHVHDVLIVGAGSAGLGAADRCAQLGLDYVVIEQERPRLLATFVLCYFVYGAKASPALWPFDVPLALFGSAEHPVTFAHWWGNLHVGEGRWAFKLNGSFWYSLAYCILMVAAGRAR